MVEASLGKEVILEREKQVNMQEGQEMVDLWGVGAVVVGVAGIWLYFPRADKTEEAVLMGLDTME